ncbi:MAG: histidinol-phosphate transaminase [Pseudomonadota bacterium]
MSIARTHIAASAAYQLADLSPPDGFPLISLSQNESLRPPSPRVEDAVIAATRKSHLYPDPDWTELRTAISHLHEVPFEQLLCGNGSLEVIDALARTFAGPERAVLAPAHAYPFFRTATRLAEARFDTAKENNLTADVDALLASVQPDTGIVFIANPGNPTGTRISKSELLRLRQGLREDVLLVIDEAYGEFADHLDEFCFEMVAEGNTVVTRTFSKAHGMAGFRVGWGLFPDEISQEVRKVLNPNNISAIAQAAAVAAISDQPYVHQTCEMVAAIRRSATDDLRGAGFSVADSFTNFVLIDFGSEAKARHADEHMRSKGIFLRGQGGVGLPHMLRMTIGPKVDVRNAIDALKDWRNGT